MFDTELEALLSIAAKANRPYEGDGKWKVEKDVKVWSNSKARRIKGTVISRELKNRYSCLCI